MLHIDCGAEGWLHRYAAKQQWRVSHFAYELDDLIQDGYVSWYICANRYRHVTDYGHMNSLFKVTYMNHVHGLAAVDKNPSYDPMVTRISELIQPKYRGLSESWILDKVNSHLLRYEGSVGRLVAESVEPVKTVLRFLLSDEGIKEMRRPFRRRLSGVRETVNSRIYRYLKLEPQGDLMTMVKTHVVSYL